MRSLDIQTVKQRNSNSKENGFILIVTMLVLVVLTVLCIGAMDTSTLEIQISANDRQSRVAFNLADSGAYASGKLISEALVAPNDPDYAANGLTFVNIPAPANSGLDPSPNAVDLFRNRVLGISSLRDVAVHGPYDFMLSMPGGTGDIYGRITARASEPMAGGGAEFASGSSGVGTGSAAGVAITFDIDVDSYAARNSQSSVSVRYRKVLGAAGGL